MKNIIRLVALILFTLVLTTSGFAQGKSKEKRKANKEK